MLKTYKKEVDKFLEYAFDQLEVYGVDVLISTENYVIAPDGMKCNGFVVEDEKDPDKITFACAIGHPFKDWFITFIHEFCHFTQWRDGSKYWYNVDEDEILWDWVLNKKTKITDMKKVDRQFKQARNLELDCERRTLKMIKRFKLPVDAKKYAKKSAAYVLFYDYMRIARKWYKIGKEPYKNTKLLRLMPTDISKPLTLTLKMETLYKECV
jgi:hypothetical protein